MEIDVPPLAKVEVGPPLYRRPGERLELISLPTARLAPARRAALALRLCPEAALALLLERELVLAWLRGSSFGEELVARLDAAARRSRVEIELWQAHGAYLAHLLGRGGPPSHGRSLASPRVAVPVRLLDRLAAGYPRLDEDPASALVAARDWEIAALIAGETMSEWAYRSALFEALSRDRCDPGRSGRSDRR